MAGIHNTLSRGQSPASDQPDLNNPSSADKEKSQPFLQALDAFPPASGELSSDDEEKNADSRTLSQREQELADIQLRAEAETGRELEKDTEADAAMTADAKGQPNSEPYSIEMEEKELTDMINNAAKKKGFMNKPAPSENLRHTPSLPPKPKGKLKRPSKPQGRRASQQTRSGNADPYEVIESPPPTLPAKRKLGEREHDSDDDMDTDFLSPSSKQQRVNSDAPPRGSKRIEGDEGASADTSSSKSEGIEAIEILQRQKARGMQPQVVIPLTKRRDPGTTAQITTTPKRGQPPNVQRENGLGNAQDSSNSSKKRAKVSTTPFISSTPRRRGRPRKGRTQNFEHTSSESEGEREFEGEGIILGREGSEGEDDDAELCDPPTPEMPLRTHPPATSTNSAYAAQLPQANKLKQLPAKSKSRVSFSAPMRAGEIIQSESETSLQDNAIIEHESGRYPDSDIERQSQSVQNRIYGLRSQLSRLSKTARKHVRDGNHVFQTTAGISLVAKCKEAIRLCEKQTNISKEDGAVTDVGRVGETVEQLFRGLENITPEEPWAQLIKRKQVTQDVYAKILPCFVQLLYALATLLEAEAASFSDIGPEEDLDLFGNLLRQVIEAYERVRAWKTKPVTSRALIGPTERDLVTPLKQIEKELRVELIRRHAHRDEQMIRAQTLREQELATQRREEERLAYREQEAKRARQQEQKREARRQEAERLKKEEEEKRRRVEEQYKWNSIWSKLWVNRLLLSSSDEDRLEQLIEEQQAGTVGMDLDANDEPFERLDIFNARNGSSQQPRRRFELSQWSDEELLSLEAALTEFTDPNPVSKYTKIFKKYCKRGQPLERYGAETIVRMADCYRDSLLDSFAQEGAAPPQFIRNIPYIGPAKY